MKNANMPAMPCEVVEVYHVDASKVPAGLSPAEDFTARERKVMSGGMTKREMMAMNAPEAPKWFFRKWASDNGTEYGNIGDNVSDMESLYFAWRTHFADSLLAELERTK